MDKTSLTRSLTEAISKIAEAESNLSEQVGSLGTRAAKDIPAAEREQDYLSLDNMRQISDELASTRQKLQSVLEQVEKDNA